MGKAGGSLQRRDDDMLALYDPNALIPQYLASLAAANARPSTIASRRAALRRFCRTLPATDTLLTAGVEHIVAFVDRDIGPQGRANTLTHLRGFYRWALFEELVDRDPTQRLKRPKLPRRLPRPMPDDDVERAFHYAPTHRVRPALYLAAYAGLRAHEIAQLRAEDLRWADRFIFIADQKGGGQGTVPLPDVLAEGLRECALPTKGWLFPYLNGDDGHVPGQRIGKAVNGYLHDLGIDHTLHTLRHWYITQAYRASGRDMRQTQELARHQSPTTTAGYTYVDPGEQTSIVNRLPRIKAVDQRATPQLPFAQHIEREPS